MDHVQSHRFAGAATAVQIGSRLPKCEGQPSHADRAVPGFRPALRRRTRRRALLHRQQTRREGRGLLRPEEGTQDPRQDREGDGHRRTLRPRLPSEVRAEPLLLRLLHAVVGGEVAGRHAGVAIRRDENGSTQDRPGERRDRHHLAGRRSQRRRPPLQPHRRHALHLHRRRQRTQPARRTQHRPGLLRLALVHSPNRRGPSWRAEGRQPSGELFRAQRQPVRRHEGSAARDLGLRLPQSLAHELRPQDRRPVGRRRRLGTVGDGPQDREGRQLRLERGRRSATREAEPETRPDAHPPADHRVAPHHRDERDRRLRLPRQEVPGTGWGVRVRRLGNEAVLGGAIRGRPPKGDARDREGRHPRVVLRRR